MVGHFSINGAKESGPTRLGLAMVDIGTGLYAGNAIMMALFEREKSGMGQYFRHDLIRLRPFAYAPACS